MLRALRNTRQVKGEPRRKWFFSNDLDLVVWFDTEGMPCAFQLAYDKYKGEHSISWNAESGYRHYVVDDGEHSAMRSDTPFLYANGPFRKDAVLEKFLVQSGNLPHTIVQLVEEKLRGFDGPIY